MANLTWDDYRDLRSHLYRQGSGKEELKALSRLPNKNELMSMLQAIEDWFTNGFLNVPTKSLKEAFETGLGQAAPNQLVHKIVGVWFRWKAGKLGI